MKERKANLFVVGAMKAGTTSFMDVISQHQQIYVSPIKEPNFFISELPKQLYEPSRFFNLEKYFQKDFPKPLHIAHLRKESDYQRLFTLLKEEKYLAEGSTMYLHAPEVAQRVKEYNPESRIIILTRDPLKRAYSHYKMLQGLGRETRSFQQVIEEEISQYKKDNLPWYSCLSMSFYKHAIASFRSLFEEVCVISFEDLVNESEMTLQKVASFLQINNFDEITITNINASRSLRFKRTFFLLKKIGLKDYFSAIFGSKIKRKIFQWASKTESETMNLSKDTLQQLERIFKKESLE